MYIIGLIDDEESQLSKIRRTIKTNAKEGEQYDFKSYLIPDKASDVVLMSHQDSVYIVHPIPVHYSTFPDIPFFHLHTPQNE